jgi:hypothetical protein
MNFDQNEKNWFFDDIELSSISPRNVNSSQSISGPAGSLWQKKEFVPSKQGDHTGVNVVITSFGDFRQFFFERGVFL